MTTRLRGGLLCAAGLCAWASAAEYELPADGSSIVGTEQRTMARYEDTLVDLARQYSVGYEEIGRANPGVDMWLPGDGTDIVLPGRRILPPGPREGIVINLPEHRLYYYPVPQEGEKSLVLTFPISIGRLGRSSPLGLTHVIAKQRRPSWFPPASIRKEHVANGDPLPAVIPPGPKNPLGEFEIRLAAGGGTYLIHGTNTPWGIGMETTHGCISMYPEDVAALFQQVPLGTKVWVLNAPVKVAYVDGEVLVEVHPPTSRQGEPLAPNLPLLWQDLQNALGSNAASIEPDLALRTLWLANGLPTVVSRPGGTSGDTAEPPSAR